MPQNMDHECGECKTDHSSQPSAQVKNVWWFTPFPPPNNVDPKTHRQLYLCCIIMFPYTEVGRK